MIEAQHRDRQTDGRLNIATLKGRSRSILSK